jgi:hypothetical protein
MIIKNKLKKSILFFCKIKYNIYTTYKNHSNLIKLRLIFNIYRQNARKFKLVNLIYLINKKKVRIHKNLVVSLKSEPDNFDQLKSFIFKATPGDTIALIPNTNYYGNLIVKNDINGNPGIHGTPDNYISIIGDSTSSIISPELNSSYVFYIENSSYIFIGNNSNLKSFGIGFNLTNAKKGFYANNCNNIIFKNLNVYNIGNEGVHFMNNSYSCDILNNYIYDTGKTNNGYGEGIYIGSAFSNWVTDNGNLIPDETKKINIKFNYVINTTAECLDIKEGTSDSLVEGNYFFGNKLSNDNYADSWIDIKGSSWYIKNNTLEITLTNGIEIKCIKTGDIVTNSGNYNTIDGNFMNCEINELGEPCSGYGVIILENTYGNKVFSNNLCFNAIGGLCNIVPLPQ